MKPFSGIILPALALAISLSAAPIFSAENPKKSANSTLQKASWIWAAAQDDTCQLRKVFSLDEKPRSASVLITADNGYELYLNGARIGSDVGAGSEIWQSVEHYDITARLTPGRNIIGIRGIDLGGIRGVIAAVRMDFKDRKPIELVTDGTWRVTRDGSGVDYSHPEFVEGPEWRDAEVVGPMGMKPWGRIGPSGKKNSALAKAQTVEVAKPDENFSWPEGVAFLGDDCSVYVPLRGDAWGVAFRIGDWSRAYTEFDLPCPSKIGRKLYTLTWNSNGVDSEARPHPGPLTQETEKHSPRTGEISSPVADASLPDRLEKTKGATRAENKQNAGSETVASAPPANVDTPPLSPGVRASLIPTSPQPKPNLRVLFDAGKGVIGSPSVSFDGKSLLVAMAREGEKFFHIYRIPVSGGEPQRLTDGPFHDIDPAELPDGRIVFTSTRVGTFEEYHQPPSRALFRMNADGSEIHPISSTLIFDNEPKVMADGRIAFIRTDNFFDRGKVETHLHVMRPDGTDGLTEIGANVGADYGSRLRAFGYGSPAPMPDGRLAFISKGGNFIASPGGNERAFQKLPDQLGELAALPDGRLLCTVLQPGEGRMNSDVLGVIDPRDNKITGIFQSTNGAIHSPLFLGARSKPPVVPDFVDQKIAGQPGATGFLFCQNARFTTKTKADWDRVRAVRVLGAKPLTVRSSHSHIVHAGHETVELGTVPLAPDGSFFVEIPADTPIALQAVDAEGRSELNEMSWIYVRPGERRSCLGCHNPRDTAPAYSEGRAMALRTPPLKLVGAGDAHRSRGNNAGVTGLMDLQFERYREVASLNRHDQREPLASGRDDIAALLKYLGGQNDALKISSAQRLAIFRSREAAPALAANLKSNNREVRVAVALALAPCGTRESVPALLAALEDADAVVSQAAAVALENITGHEEPFDSTIPDGTRQHAEAWKNWFAKNSWEVIERGLIARLENSEARPHPGPLPQEREKRSPRTGEISSPVARAALPESSENALSGKRAKGKQNAESETIAAAPPANVTTLSLSPGERAGVRAGIEPETKPSQRAAIVALGHIGGSAAQKALREFVSREAQKNPYPPFEKNNRTDSFTFSATSPLNPRTLQEAVRALGQLRDTNAVPLLRELLSKNIDPKFGNLFLAEAVIESLGRIATPETETILIETFAALKNYWEYVGWYSDHPALYACHASPLHARIIEALDLIASTRAAGIVPQLILSVPTDPDRALFPENDDYETLVGRLIRRSGRGPEVIDTCLALLGDSNAIATTEIKTAVSTTHAAWAGHPGPENRAAQILSLVCRDAAKEPQVRDAFKRYLTRPEEPIERTLGNPKWAPVRHWVLFYLARTLGQLSERASVETLVSVLGDNLNEARHGRPDPSSPEIHFLQLDYTPCWRAAAAWALGEIGDRGATAPLINVVRNMENATDTRHAAATALERIADPASLEELEKLAADYPEISTRRALLLACEKIRDGTKPRQLAGATQ